MSFGVRRLELHNFRNYQHLSVDLEAGFTILAGPNAQGKTNFLEALYLLSTTRLLRGQRDAEAILKGHGTSKVWAELISGTELAIGLATGVKKRVTLNGANLPRAADILGRLPCVTITIYDLELVRGEPSDRRLFLDLELSSLYPSYLRHLSHYKRALEQRNALLKTAQDRHIDAFAFESWEEQLAEHGSAMRTFRREYIALLRTPAQEVHREMSSVDEKLDIDYFEKDAFGTPAELLAEFSRNRAYEIMRGTTTIGPHRDDVVIMIDDREAKLYGSQGQQRTAVIAIKLATLKTGSAVLGGAPLLLLDDILSDLDPTRRAKLCEIVLDQASQVVLTCTEAEAAGKGILDRARVYNVLKGTVTPANGHSQ